MTFAIIAFHADDAPHMYAARQIRQAVFCDEQGISAAEEWDGKDSICQHFLVLDGGLAVGCARLRPYGPGIYKIERVAVLKYRRGTGAGKAVMAKIIRRLDKATIVLNAQLVVEGFYNRLGFAREGAVFDEAGIPHIHMVRGSMGKAL